MHDQRVTLTDGLQVVARLAARDHEVLGGDLEPVDIGLVLEDVLEMVRAQSETEAEERICHIINDLQCTAGDWQSPAVCNRSGHFTTDILAGLFRCSDKTGALAGRLAGTGIVGRFAVIVPTANIDA